MLLPALNQARERGRMISCTGNLKQNGTGFAMYAQDFNDRIAFRWRYDIYMWWGHFLGDYLKDETRAKAMLNKGTFRCPSMGATKDAFDQTYGCNLSTTDMDGVRTLEGADASDPAAHIVLMLPRIPKQEKALAGTGGRSTDFRIYLLGESRKNDDTQNLQSSAFGRTSGSYAPNLIHLDRLNMLHSDGSVHPAARADLKQRYSFTTKLFWKGTLVDAI